MPQHFPPPTTSPHTARLIPSEFVTEKQRTEIYAVNNLLKIAELERYLEFSSNSVSRPIIQNTEEDSDSDNSCFDNTRSSKLRVHKTLKKISLRSHSSEMPRNHKNNTKNDVPTLASIGGV